MPLLVGGPLGGVARALGGSRRSLHLPPATPDRGRRRGARLAALVWPVALALLLDALVGYR